MRTKLALAAMLAVALIAPAALPCGAPFGNGINADPHQDIIVVHKDGMETYVFQPRFCGSAREFGLVLPVPSKLAAQPALTTADVFSKLISISQPQYQYVTQCSWGVGGSRGGSNGADGGTGTTVVSSGIVGFMDYAQLDAVSVDALTAWLTQNGYPYDAQATAAFDYYVQKGWYFLTFKVDQGLIDAGSSGSTCKDLGPVKLSFPTSIPVVPTRMATARSKDTSGVLSYSTSFAWRIFGITEGSQQLGFASGASSSRALNFSGLVSSSDVASMAGLAAAGDRVTKMTIAFNYGSTAPDVALGLVAGADYREVVTVVSYIACSDGGTDAGPEVRRDSAGDASQPADTATKDTAADSASIVIKLDAAGTTAPETNSDAEPPVTATDTAPASPDTTPIVVPDAGIATNSDAGTPDPEVSTNGGGGWCSFATHSSPGGTASALIVGLLLALRRRRRR